MNYSRRNFLKAAGSGAVALTTVGAGTEVRCFCRPDCAKAELDNSNAQAIQEKRIAWRMTFGWSATIFDERKNIKDNREFDLTGASKF